MVKSKGIVIDPNEEERRDRQARRIKKRMDRVDETEQERQRRLKRKSRKDTVQTILQVLLFFFRLAGAVVICLDSVFKQQYLVVSRFNSSYTRRAYFFFLLLRPLCIAFLIFYNFLFEHCKILRFIKRRSYIIEVERAKVAAKKEDKSGSEEDNVESKRLLKENDTTNKKQMPEEGEPEKIEELEGGENEQQNDSAAYNSSTSMLPKSGQVSNIDTAKEEVRA